jgi:hypothetical protein
MTRLPAPLRQLCSSIAPTGRRERWGVVCDGRVDVCWRSSLSAVPAGSGGNDDDYVFTARRFVALRVVP